MKDDEDILREKFKKENPESLDLFKKVVDNIFGDSGEDDDES